MSLAVSEEGKGRFLKKSYDKLTKKLRKKSDLQKTYNVHEIYKES